MQIPGSLGLWCHRCGPPGASHLGAVLVGNDLGHLHNTLEGVCRGRNGFVDVFERCSISAKKFNRTAYALELLNEGIILVGKASAAGHVDDFAGTVVNYPRGDSLTNPSKTTWHGSRGTRWI